MKSSKKKPEKKDGPGRPMLYKSEIHDKSILQILSRGDFPEDFFKEWGICRATYSDWQKRNKSFKSAVSRGKQYGLSEWLKKPLFDQSRSFSHNYWALVMKNVYKWGAVKIPELQKEMSPLDMVNTTTNLLARGRIPERLADKFTNLAMSKLRIIEATELEQRIASLEKLTRH